MKITLIDKNYIFNHRIVKFIGLLAILYFFFLLRMTSSIRTDDSFEKYQDLIGIISSSIFLILIFLWFLNGFMYSRIGCLILEFDKILIQKNGWNKTLELKNYKKIKVTQFRGKEYAIKLDNSIYHIELNNSELKSLKSLKTIIPLDFPKMSIIDRIKYSIRKFSKKNRAFIDDVNRS
ncbi:hypothetical protein [Aquimarina sp. MMG016]|uniref:hypothetical protein n=1 Tax=Aquimarina sp. MMG016 TaxID=2822690 RepID=UPI001B3A7507|nr:hypothetical protein [Aquimarina sp. MMG016]MBQ4822772.1 hypothetical protein [Aquimarina sp. MMG016]